MAQFRNFRNSSILPVALIFVIIIIAVIALVSIGRAVFTSTSTANTAVKVDTGREALLDTSVSHSVQVTVRGPIVADESFHSYRIAITPSSRTLTTYKGYIDTVVDQSTLSNNVASYEQFVYALDKANISKGTQLDGDKNDLRGICATGQVYDFAIMDSDKAVKELWTSTCKGSKGSLDANVTQLMNLFDNQVPGSTKLIDKINL